MAEDHELVSRVHEASTQTQFTKKNVSIQFRSKHSSKGKFSFLFCGRNPNYPILILLNKRGKLFSLISLTQVFKRPFPRKVKVHNVPFFFVTSTPSQSEDEMSEGDPEEEMDADDDPSYEPNPEEETDDEKEFDDFDDRLCE